MKICKLQGGLGNQMFQYATTRALEIKQSKNILLDLEFIEFNSKSTDYFTARNYELNIFENLRANLLNKRWFRFLKSQNIVYKIARNIPFCKVKFVYQKENEFVEFPLYSNLYLDGYFQSEKYFKDIRTDILKDFKFPALDKVNVEREKLMLTSNNSVSLHVRHGDYVKLANVLKTHGVLPLDYYKKAVQSLKDKIGSDLDIYIFTDDPEFVKQNFEFLSNYTLIEDNTEHNSWKDMCLMKSCCHHIIANSSFSWWGAWLSQRDGITVAPEKWFNPEYVDFDIDDFIPNTWLKINV